MERPLSFPSLSEAYKNEEDFSDDDLEDNELTTEAVVTLSAIPKKESSIFYTPLSQKEWTEMVHKCLLYASANNPPASSNLFKDERQLLPLHNPSCIHSKHLLQNKKESLTTLIEEFFDAQGPVMYCYLFKGAFLPSGSLDGRVWKPSQSARPTGDGLMKRYFYYKEGNVKINRQVIWLTSDENWCFLDYRNNFRGKIRMPTVMTPSGFQFQKLVQLADSHVTIPQQLKPERKRKFRMKRTTLPHPAATGIDSTL